MATALYVVIRSQDRWWVDFEGKAHGPYASRDAAAAEAGVLAKFAAHTGRESEVLVPDDTGRHRVAWSSLSDPRGFRTSVPTRAAE